MWVPIDGLVKFNLGKVEKERPAKWMKKQHPRKDWMKIEYSNEMGIRGGNIVFVKVVIELIICKGWSADMMIFVSSLYLS